MLTTRYIPQSFSYYNNFLALFLDVNYRRRAVLMQLYSESMTKSVWPLQMCKAIDDPNLMDWINVEIIYSVKLIVYSFSSATELLKLGREIIKTITWTTMAWKGKLHSVNHKVVASEKCISPRMVKFVLTMNHHHHYPLT